MAHFLCPHGINHPDDSSHADDGDKANKKLMVFQGRRHDLPEPVIKTAFADWIKDRFQGKPMESEIIYVDMMGGETKK
jgi:hypothetical protein